MAAAALGNRAAWLSGSCREALLYSSSLAGCKPIKVIRQPRSLSQLRIAAGAPEQVIEKYTRPSWSEFELGKFPVWWQASDGQPPTAGGQLIIFFNPDASSLKPNDVYGVAFNGGFNQPIMCGGEPRIMTRKDRGSSCAPLYSIKINLPKHTLTLEFSFTNGKDWDGPYKLRVAVPPRLRNKPPSFFSEGLAAELSRDGACEKAIYPEAVMVVDRCPLPAYNPEGWKCDLDFNPGCTDKENPFYDPLADVDDGTCPYVEENEN